MSRNPLLVGVLVNFALSALIGLPAAALPRGQVVERVVTAREPARAYALYLPAAYRPDRAWPILYAFDYRGSALEVVERFRPGAERWGWIVAASYDANDQVPMEENFKVMSALWADTHARLALDDRRVYAFGSSGLTRFACMLGLTAPESLAGVIAASGGFPLGHPPSRDTPFAFFATVGNADFNYYELRDLDERMAALGLPHRVEVFAGAHERPPAEVLSRAIGWMEVAALRRGRRPPSAELVEGVWGEELARAEGLARAGDAPAALAAYRGLAADFAGLRPAADLEAVARRAAALAAAPAVERAAAAERARDARDRAYLESVPRLLQTAGAEEAPERVARTLAGLGIPELQRSARDSPDPAERLSAERRLAAVYIQTGLYLPREAAERGQYDRAIFFLELAGAIEPGVPHVPFRLATAWAQKGDRAKALDYLALAVAKGWTDLVALEGERAFDPLRGSDEYRKIVGELLRRGKPSVR